MTLFNKLASIPPASWLWGALVLSLGIHFLWCQFVAYPSAFERQLRRGKPWVYIPLRWKGFKKIAILSFSRLLLLVIAGVGTTLFVHHSPRHPAWAVVLAALVLILVLNRLDGFWAHFRYRQQEDAYYRLHDELRLKLENEGRDHTESQFRSLAAYQHQQKLHKADEAGKFLKTLRHEARSAHQIPAPTHPVEA